MRNDGIKFCRYTWLYFWIVKIYNECLNFSLHSVERYVFQFPNEKYIWINPSYMHNMHNYVFLLLCTIKWISINIYMCLIIHIFRPQTVHACKLPCCSVFTWLYFGLLNVIRFRITSSFYFNKLAQKLYIVVSFFHVR